MSDFMIKLEMHYNNRCMALSDSLLQEYFYTILWQCKYLGRTDLALYRYQSELEYRGIRYRL